MTKKIFSIKLQIYSLTLYLQLNKTIQNFEVICKKFRKENKIIAPPYHIKKTKIEAHVIQ